MQVTSKAPITSTLPDRNTASRPVLPRTRIAFHSENGPKIGGSDVVMGVLAEALDPALWEPWLLVSSAYPVAKVVKRPSAFRILNAATGAEMFLDEMSQPAAAEPAPANPVSTSPSAPARPANPVRRFIGLLRSTWRLSRFLRQHDIKVLHAMDGGPQISVIAAKLAGCQAIVTYQAPPPIERGLDLWLTRLSYAMADVCLACSRSVRDQWLAYMGRSESKFRVIYNGVAQLQPTRDKLAQLREELAIPARSVVVGFTGRLEPEKGCLPMLEAIRLVAQQAPDTHFVLVGDGSLRARMQECVHEWGLASRIQFTGFRPDASMAIHLFDIAVIPSLMQEPFSLVVLETMDAAKPIIASRVGGIPEAAIDGETALLVPPGEPEPLANAILSLVRDPERRMAFGKAAQLRVRQNFTWDAMRQQTLGVYSSVVRKA